MNNLLKSARFFHLGRMITLPDLFSKTKFPSTLMSGLPFCQKRNLSTVMSTNAQHKNLYSFCSENKLLSPKIFLTKFDLTGIFSIRTKIRDHFPRPSEYKRIRKHGWKKRMSTRAGREIIMRRILKGRHCLTH